MTLSRSLHKSLLPSFSLFTALLASATAAHAQQVSDSASAPLLEERSFLAGLPGLPSLPALPALSTYADSVNLNHPGALKVGCPYKLNSSKNKNSGFLDSYAFYAIAQIPLSLPDGAAIRVEGQYQPVRYFSLQSYDGSKGGNYIDTLPDSDIVPANGATPNPNISALPNSNNYTDHYTLKLRYAAPPANDADREPNALYVGPASTQSSPTRVAKQIIYRIYLANSGVDPFTLPLPNLIYSGATGDISLNNTPDASRCAQIETASSLTVAVNPAVFPNRNIRFEPVTNARSTVLYPNGDANYLRAAFSKDYGPLVVVRSRRMPTPSQTLVESRVRYWSLCQYALGSSAVYSCLADGQTTTQSDGYDTFVLSAAADRPALANPAAGYNWIEFGTTRSELVVLRQLLSTPDFLGNYARSVAAPKGTVADALGSWAPDISYCDAATFNATAASGGAALIAACHAASLPPLLPGLF